MLLDIPLEERLEYLPTYWSKLIKSALLNDALITEADGWKAASVLVPPGKYIDSTWSLLWAGFLSVLWRIGFTGLKVDRTCVVIRTELTGVEMTATLDRVLRNDR
jgi:hypothetical protein